PGGGPALGLLLDPFERLVEVFVGPLPVVEGVHLLGHVPGEDAEQARLLLGAVQDRQVLVDLLGQQPRLLLELLELRLVQEKRVLDDLALLLMQRVACHLTLHGLSEQKASAGSSGSSRARPPVSRPAGLRDRIRRPTSSRSGSVCPWRRAAPRGRPSARRRSCECRSDRPAGRTRNPPRPDRGRRGAAPAPAARPPLL